MLQRSFARGNGNTSVYSKQDCLNFIIKFRKENDKDPTNEEIRKLHKKGSCPNLNSFKRYGGVPLLLEGLGFKPSHPQHLSVSRGEVRLTVLKWGKGLLEKGEDPIKHLAEIPFVSAVIRYYGTKKNCLLVLGLVGVRTGKQANDKHFIYK